MIQPLITRAITDRRSLDAVIAILKTSNNCPEFILVDAWLLNKLYTNERARPYSKLLPGRIYPVLVFEYKGVFLKIR